MLLGRLRIRGKLALLVVIPLLGMVGLAVPVVPTGSRAASRPARHRRPVALAGRVGTLVQDLQQERLLSVGFLLGRVDRIGWCCRAPTSPTGWPTCALTSATADRRDRAAIDGCPGRLRRRPTCRGILGPAAATPGR